MSGYGRAVVGLDAGGTNTIAVVLDDGGRERARAEGPGAAVDPRDPLTAAGTMAALLRRMAEEGALELPVAALCAGVAGAGSRDVRRALARALEEAGLAHRVEVRTDGEVALHDAHGSGPGLLLIAGTGSSAWGRDAGGRTARAGGWGPWLGDEGSGWAIATAALRRICRGADGRVESSGLGPRLLERLGLDRPEELVGWIAAASRSEVAALAAPVLEAADEGDPAALPIVEEAVAELASAVDAVKRRLGPWDGPPPVGLAGGLLAPGRPLRRRVADAVEGLGARPIARAVDPARGAARLVLDVTPGG